MANWMAAQQTGQTAPTNRWRPAIAIAVGAGAALFLGVYAEVHQPAGQTTFRFGFASMISFKSWFTTLAMALAVAQLLTGLRVRDRLRWPRTIPLWLNDLHRLLGTLALLVSLPVAYHCLWSLGLSISNPQPRVLIHSLVGCVFYGAFITKVLAIRIDRMPEWMVPLFGGLTFGLLLTVWASSAAFFLTGQIG